MVIKPPNCLVTKNTFTKKNIFLAGSIEMGKAEDWQEKVTLLLKNPNITIINPRRKDWDDTWKQEYENAQFYQQVNWELNGLDKAHIILMNLLPNTKSPISLLELGLYANTGKLLVVCPKGFWRKGNVDIVCERFNVPVFENVEDAVSFIKSYKLHFPWTST